MTFPEIKRAVDVHLAQGKRSVKKNFNSLFTIESVNAERVSRAKWAKALAEKLECSYTLPKDCLKSKEPFSKPCRKCTVKKELLVQAEKDEVLCNGKKE